LKKDLKMKLKKKKKKNKSAPGSILAQAAQPNSPAGPPLLPFPFLFRSGADRRTPPVSPYSPSFLSSSPASAGRRRMPLSPPSSRLFPFLSFLPEPAN
jgi:hypothetical protein